MITQVTIEGFKLMRERPIPLSRVTTAVGPNNGGKTSLLQALLVWQLALQNWVKRRKYDPAEPSKLTAKERKGIGLPLEEFTFMESASTYELWPDHVVSAGENKPSLITIRVDGITASVSWSCAMHVQFRDPRTVLVRPADVSQDGIVRIPAQALKEVIVSSRAIHGSLPTTEMLLQREGVDFHVQTGEANRALRSMLYWLDCGADDIRAEEPSSAWRELTVDIANMFDVDIQRPERLPNSAIEVTYRNRRAVKSPRVCPVMNLNTAGSGFLQILQLLALFHSRRGKATLFLLDEPEAHLESIRQQDLYRLFAERSATDGFQIVIASHSEQFMEEAIELSQSAGETQHLLMVVDGEAHALPHQEAQKLARQAIADIPAVDYYETARRPRWLYVEDKSDSDILREWARVLDHKEALAILDSVKATANHHYLKSNDRGSAFRHFKALQFVHPEVKGVVVTDRTDKGPTEKPPIPYMEWARREIENYLLSWPVIERVFWREAGKNKEWPPENNLDLFRDKHAKELRRLFTERYMVAAALTDEHHPDLINKKASDDVLVLFFKEAFATYGIFNSLPKENLCLLAAAMKPEEIHADVKKMLDAIAVALA